MIPEEHLTPEQDFAYRMFGVVCQSALGGFDENLWGLALTTELETETVDAYFFFSTEPTDLDRYELSEFAFMFDAIGEVGLRIHRTVMARERLEHDHGWRWCFLRRHRAVVLPDDAGFDELDY